MRISDWSSDVCSSDLISASDEPGSMPSTDQHDNVTPPPGAGRASKAEKARSIMSDAPQRSMPRIASMVLPIARTLSRTVSQRSRSEEHTSELQSLMRNSYAVFCLKKKKKPHTQN